MTLLYRMKRFLQKNLGFGHLSKRGELWHRKCKNYKNLYASIPRDLELAALQNLWPLPFCSEYFPSGEENVRHARDWAKVKREWANTIEDRQIRKAYLGWIEYVELRASEEEEELRTHKEANAYKAREEQRRSEQRRASVLSGQIPKPPR